MMVEPSHRGRSEQGKGLTLPTVATRWERVFVVVTLFTCCRGFDIFFYMLAGSGQEGLSDSTPTRLLWLAVLYLTGAVLLLRHHTRDLAAVLSQNKLLVVAITYILASSLWAVDPSTSFRRGVAFTLTMTFCVYLALRFPKSEILKLAAWALLLVAAVSVVVIILAPEIGMEGSARKGGWWRGICMINTSFGRFMALGVLVVWCLRRTEWQLQRYDVLAFMLLVVCTYQAHAATALAAVVVAFASLIVLWSPRPFNAPMPIKLAVVGVLGAALLITLPAYYDDILELLGRDATLTDRVYIWQAAYELGWKRPLLGAGYESFWIERNAAGAFYNMFGSMKTVVGNGHNGYLDAWLEMGFVGLALVGMFLGLGLFRVLRYRSSTEEGFGEFFGALLVFVAVYSIAEKVIFVHSEITWVLFVTGLIAIRWRADAPAPAEDLDTGWADRGLPRRTL